MIPPIRAPIIMNGRRFQYDGDKIDSEVAYHEGLDVTIAAPSTTNAKVRIATSNMTATDSAVRSGTPVGAAKGHAGSVLVVGYICGL